MSRTQGATKAPSDAGAFLAPHSIDLLPLASQAKNSLHQFGLHTMGDVASMREELLVDQFGLAGRKAWQLCHGIDDNPLVPLKCEESIAERISLPYFFHLHATLATAMDTLLQRAFARPQMRGRYAGRADLQCILDRALPWQKTVHFKQPVSRWERASTIIKGQMEGHYPQTPTEEMTLTLANLMGESGTQMGLLPDIKVDRERLLVEAERQLQARTRGRHSLYRVVDVAPWHPAPEMRAVQVPIHSSGTDGMKPLSVPTAVAVQEGPDQQPEAVRLGKRWHQVTVEDLWSFDLWWMPEPLTRTYYQVIGDDRRRVTLFRDHWGNCWYQQGS